ncbi:MAG: hypothetical protein ACNA7I_07305 [Candidatus Methanoperedens sp.]
MKQNQIPSLITKIKTTTPAKVLETRNLDFNFPHLEPINHDRWSDLNSRVQLETSLTAPESQELSALEEENMKTIEKAYQRLRDDNEIQACIRQIKAHPWVRVAEGR